MQLICMNMAACNKIKPGTCREVDAATGGLYILFTNIPPDAATSILALGKSCRTDQSASTSSSIYILTVRKLPVTWG